MGVWNTQTTLRRRVTLKGVGLHSGAMTKCVIHPAPANSGIVFVRSDLKNAPVVQADISKVIRTDMSTTLGVNGVMIATVEHLMAAFYGMGITNALVEIDGPEVPIMDGSSREFADAFEDAGIRSLGVAQKVLRLRRNISVQAGDKYIDAKPSNGLVIRGKISFKHGVIGEQVYSFKSGKSFREEIAAARTFGFLREVEYLHKKGLAKGGSLENAVVLDDTRVLNPEGLRFNDEFVRHKVLDALGDFALLGLSLQADVEVHKSGHELHTGFIRKVLEDVSNYEIVEAQAQPSRHEHAELIEEEISPLVAAAV
ncbi:MAG TPA: UDP-3-O-acyl-N-acetylglucosamine deacetylase [Oligoflexia bacterium]|nr:UDP-3-O-acyl-N-acetylglucosamine deacetylase [Oligoflexia bacterium]